MTLTAEQILAMASLLAAAFAGYNSYRTTQRAVKRDEVEVLRQQLREMDERLRSQDREIATLRAENSNLHNEVNRLRDKNSGYEREIAQLQFERSGLKDRVKELERLVGGPLGSVEEKSR